MPNLFRLLPFSSRRGRRWSNLPPAWPLLIVLLLLLIPTTAHAYFPISESSLPLDERTHPAESACVDREELASVIQAEAFSQPVAAQIAIAQIVKREADSRGMSICALTHLTHFVAVRRYADAHPTSWTAHQIAHPLEWSITLADEVLLGQVEDMTAGAMHFDGQPHDGDLFVVGQIHFRP